jgi:hypothetical protein
VAEAPTPDGPPRRRSSWSLKSIVEDVSGRSIGDFQEPGRPVHPYLKVKGAEPPRVTLAPPLPAEDGSPEAYDPVGHLYPPLVGAPARAYHGPENEHHSETLARHPAVPPGVGEKPRGSAGPSRRPERLYLHYLLLHLDRLGDSALAYLQHAVEEEIAHRSRPAPTPEPARAASAPPPELAEGPTPLPAT